MNTEEELQIKGIDVNKLGLIFIIFISYVLGIFSHHIMGIFGVIICFIMILVFFETKLKNTTIICFMLIPSLYAGSKEAEKREIEYQNKITQNNIEKPSDSFVEFIGNPFFGIFISLILISSTNIKTNK